MSIENSIEALIYLEFKDTVKKKHSKSLNHKEYGFD